MAVRRKEEGKSERRREGGKSTDTYGDDDVTEAVVILASY